MRRPLELVFEDRDELRRALEGDLAKGGAFVACDDPPPLQARVVVAVRLGFARERILLDADVVHVQAGDGAPSPDAVGVGVQFLESTEKLLRRLGTFLGDPPAKPAAPPARPAASGDDLFAADDVFDGAAPGRAAPAADEDLALSDGELAAMLGEEGEPGEVSLDDAIEAEAAPAEPGDPFGWFDPGAREIDPAAEAPPEAFEGPAPGDPSFEPRVVTLEEGDDEPLPELGEPGTGHRVRQD